MKAVKGPAFCRRSTSKMRSASGVDGGMVSLTYLDCTTGPLRDNPSHDFRHLRRTSRPEKEPPAGRHGFQKPEPHPVDLHHGPVHHARMEHQNEDPQPWQISLILGLILLALGGQGILEWVGYGARSYRAIGTDRWVAVEAEVLGAEAVESGNFLTGSGWLPTISYAYEIDGTRHTGDRFSFNDPASGLTESEAVRLAATFSKGQRIEIHVDPDDPTRSTMIREHDEERPAGFLVDVLVLVIGSVMLYGAIIDRRRKRQDRSDDAVRH